MERTQTNVRPMKTGESAGLKTRRVIAYVVLSLLSLICLFFFYILIINATRAHSDIQKGFSFLPGSFLIENIKSLMAEKSLPVLTGIRNSLFVSCMNALLATYFSALTAYAIHAYDFKLKKVALAFILLIMMIPTQVSTLGFIRLMNQWKLTNNFLPLIAPAVASPIVFFFMKQYMESALPLEIVEAARIDGSGEFRTFNFIVMPILKPAMAVQGIFTFVGAWNNYFTPALLLKSTDMKTLPILIAQLRGADFLKFNMGEVYVMIMLSILPIIVVYLLLSKFIVRGISIGSVKG